MTHWIIYTFSIALHVSAMTPSLNKMYKLVSKQVNPYIYMHKGCKAECTNNNLMTPYMAMAKWEKLFLNMRGQDN